MTDMNGSQVDLRNGYVAEGCDVSVVIPARNAAGLLSVQLAALAAQRFEGGLEVIIVDNGSQDSTGCVGTAWSQSFRSIVTVHADERVGIAYARNEGARIAQGRFLLFCDADDMVDAGWVDAMVSALSRHDVVGGHLELAVLNNEVTQGWRTDPIMSGLPVALRFLPYAVGANMGFLREVYAALGGCDESYVGGHEEVELCWRAQLSGYQIAYAPKAIVQYRLRDNIAALARQRFGSGRTYAQLHAAYADRIDCSARWSTEALRCGSLILRAPQLLRRRSAGRWIFEAAWHAGRICGSINAGLLSPE